MEQSPEVKLAYEIAEALNDLHSIDWHIGLTKKYSENFLRQKLNDALTNKKTKNPAKLYNYLIQIYGNRPRH